MQKYFWLILILLIAAGCSSAAEQAVQVYNDGARQLAELGRQVPQAADRAALAQSYLRFREVERQVRDRIREIRSRLTRDTYRQFATRGTAAFRRYLDARRGYLDSYRARKAQL